MYKCTCTPNNRYITKYAQKKGEHLHWSQLIKELAPILLDFFLRTWIYCDYGTTFWSPFWNLMSSFRVVWKKHKGWILLIEAIAEYSLYSLVLQKTAYIEQKPSCPWTRLELKSSSCVLVWAEFRSCAYRFKDTNCLKKDMWNRPCSIQLQSWFGVSDYHNFLE